MSEQKHHSNKLTNSLKVSKDTIQLGVAIFTVIALLGPGLHSLFTSASEKEVGELRVKVNGLKIQLVSQKQELQTLLGQMKSQEKSLKGEIYYLRKEIRYLRRDLNSETKEIRGTLLKKK